MERRIAFVMSALRPNEPFAEQPAKRRGEALLKAAAEALEEAQRDARWDEDTQRITEKYDALCVFASTEFARPGARPYVDPAAVARARADRLVLGSSRFSVPETGETCLDCVQVDMGWDVFGAVDMAWVASAVMRTRSDRFVKTWLGEGNPNALARMSDMREFLGRIRKCSKTCFTPFMQLGCEGVVFGLIAASAAYNARPESWVSTTTNVERVRQAHFMVRALVARAQFLCAYEHPAHIAGEYALSSAVVAASDAQSAAEVAEAQETNGRERLQRLLDAYEAEMDLKEQMEDAADAERSAEAAAREDADDPSAPERRREAARARAERRALARRRARAFAMDESGSEGDSSDSSEAEGQARAHEVEDDDDDDDEEMATAAAAAAQARRERERRRKASAAASARVREPTVAVSMRFATEVRLLSSHLLRDLAESDTIRVAHAQLTQRDEDALGHLRLWMFTEISKLNADSVRADFRAFRAERLCTTADFGVDRTRDPTKPHASALDVIQARGDTLGGDSSSAYHLLPEGTDLDAIKVKYRADFTDFCLHKLSMQTGSSALTMLAGKCRRVPWYTRPRGAAAGIPLVFWNGSRLCYVCVRNDDWSEGSVLAFTSVTHCLVYFVRRGVIKLRTAVPGETNAVDISRMRPFLDLPTASTA